MSRRSVLACVLALAAIAFLSLPASAGHHEAGESAKKPEAPKPAPHRLSDEDLKRVTANATETAPEKFKVEFDTTKGKIVLEVHREWSPNGVDRFYNLVKVGFYEDVAFFRVIQGFMAQFGLHGDPRVTRAWNRRAIKDDPVKQSNLRGYVTFAKRNQRNSRTTQLFINLVDNKGLDRQGFAPFAQVVEGMDVVDSIFAIGEGGPRGPGPNQRQITGQGNAYLKKQFPKLDYLKSARIVE